MSGKSFGEIKIFSKDGVNGGRSFPSSPQVREGISTHQSSVGTTFGGPGEVPRHRLNIQSSFGRTVGLWFYNNLVRSGTVDRPGRRLCGTVIDVHDRRRDRDRLLFLSRSFIMCLFKSRIPVTKIGTRLHGLVTQRYIFSPILQWHSDRIRTCVLVPILLQKEYYNIKSQFSWSSDSCVCERFIYINL